MRGLDRGSFSKVYIFNALTHNPSFPQIKSLNFVRRIDAGISPVLYYLSDLNGDEIRWAYYEPDLTKVDEDKLTNYLVVDQILKEKTEDGVTSYLVNFKYQSRKFRRWLRKEQMVRDARH